MPNQLFVDLQKYPSEPEDSSPEEPWQDTGIEKLWNVGDLSSTKIKRLLRNGVPDHLRKTVWSRTLKLQKLHAFEKDYERALVRIYGADIPANPAPPTFGGRLHRRELFLSKQGWTVVDHILSIIARDYPQVDYCPFIPPLVVVLLHHLETPGDVLGAISVILNASLKHHPDDRWSFFPVYKKDIKVFIQSFGTVLQHQLPKLHSHLQQLEERHTSKRSEPFYARFLTDFFVGVFPFYAVCHVVDSFLLEGFKVLYRYALATLSFNEERILQCMDIDSVVHLFHPLL
ncbi:hypothetical protein M427DRAFT_127380, partial [Gonapodya prolifera JEL478]